MWPLILSAAAVFAAAALFVAGNLFLGTTVGLRLSHEDYEPAWIGLISAHYAVGFVAGTLIGPQLIRRVGHIRVFAAFAALNCCAALVHGAVLYAPLWALLRLFSGIAGAVMMVVLESWINAHASPSARGRVMGIYMINYYASGALGQLLLTVAPPEDYRSYSLAAGLLVLSLAPLALTTLNAPPMAQSSRLGFKALLKVSPIAVGGALTAGFCLSSFYQMGPIYIQRLGLDLALTGKYMAAAVFAAMLLQLPVGKLADTQDRKWVIFGIAILTATAAITLSFLGPRSLVGLFATSMLFMSLMTNLYPTCLAQMHNRLQGEKPVAANAGQLLCFGMGACVGPIVSSIMMSLRGPTGLFLTIGLVLAIYAWFVAWRIRKIEESQNFARTPYVAVGGETTPAMAQMDPRTRGDVIP
jgi:MFS family permease